MAFQEKAAAMNQLLEELNSRDDEMKNEERSAKNKLVDMFQDMLNFIEELELTMKNNNLNLSYIKPSSKGSQPKTGLEQPLLDDKVQTLAVREIMEQHDEVQEREKDVVFIHDKSKQIKHFSEKTLNVIVENDLQLGEIQKKTVTHDNRVKMEVNPNLVKAKEAQDNLRSRGFCIAGVVALLALLFILLVYFVVSKKS